MIKMWAKVMIKDKIIKQTVFKKDGEIDYSEFFDYISTMCEKLDISTPVIIKPHIFHYAKYNVVKFTKNDFVDSINFDKLVVENIDR